MERTHWIVFLVVIVILLLIVVLILEIKKKHEVQPKDTVVNVKVGIKIHYSTTLGITPGQQQMIEKTLMVT